MFIGARRAALGLAGFLLFAPMVSAQAAEGGSVGAEPPSRHEIWFGEIGRDDRVPARNRVRLWMHWQQIEATKRDRGYESGPSVQPSAKRAQRPPQCEALAQRSIARYPISDGTINAEAEAAEVGARSKS